MVGVVSRGTTPNGVGMVIAKIEPLAGSPCVPPTEMEGREFQIGHVMIHQIPMGDGVGSSISVRRGI